MAAPSSSAIRAGSAFVELTLKGGEKVLKGLDIAGEKLQGFGTAAVAAGGVVAGAMGGAFKMAVDQFDAIKKASDRMGAPAEKVSALGYAAEQSGESLATVEAATKGLQQRLTAAAQGNDAVAEAFNRVGLSAEDLLKLPLDEQFAAIADALQGIEDPAIKAATAQQLMGKAGRNMLPMMKDGAAGIRELMDEAEKVGSVISSDQAAKGERAGDAIDRAWKSVKNTVRSVGAVFVEQVARIEQVSAKVVDNLKAVREWISENQDLVLTVAAVTAGVIAAGAALVALGAGLTFVVSVAGAVGTVISGIGAVLGAIVSPVGAIIAGLVLLAPAAAYAGFQLASLLDTGEFTSWSDMVGGMKLVADYVMGPLTQAFEFLKETFLTAWDGIRSALATGSLKKAFEIALLGLDVLWKGFLVALQVGWNTFKNWFVDGWHEVMTGIALTLRDVLKFFEDMINQMIDALPEAVRKRAGLEHVEFGLRSEADLLDDLRDKLKQIHKERDAALEQRKKELELARAALKQASEEAQQFEQITKAVQAGVAGFLAFQRVAGAKGKAGPAPRPEAIAKEVAAAGTFSATVDRLQFERGPSVEKEILSVNKSMDQKLGDIRDKIDQDEFE